MLELTGYDGRRTLIDPMCVACVVEWTDNNINMPGDVATIVVDGYQMVVRDSPRHVAASIMEARKPK